MIVVIPPILLGVFGFEVTCQVALSSKLFVADLAHTLLIMDRIDMYV